MAVVRDAGPAVFDERRRRLVGSRYQRWVKPALDRLIAAGLLMLLSSFLIMLAVVTLLDSGRPVIFRQERVGQYGRRISVIRFRTVDTKSALWRRTLAGDPVDTSHAQPGITRVGRWMLRSKVDRLPELFNVLRGDMSLVGPRPVMPHELSSYGHRDWVRLRAIPGVTCLWQLSDVAAGALTTGSRDVDQDYVFNVTFRNDLAILGRTLKVLFRQQR